MRHDEMLGAEYDYEVMMFEIEADRQERIASAVTRIERWVLELNASLGEHDLELEQREIDAIASALDELALLATGI